VNGIVATSTVFEDLKSSIRLYPISFPVFDCSFLSYTLFRSLRWNIITVVTQPHCLSANELYTCSCFATLVWKNYAVPDIVTSMGQGTIADEKPSLFIRGL